MRRAITACVAATLAYLASACETPPTRSSIVIAEGTDIGTLLPVVETSALDAEINSQLYLGLNSARWGANGLEYVIDDLCLSERWEYSQDSTTLVYFLRSDAVWSDGHPIDAGDVVFTYELLRNPDIASPYIDSWEYLDSVVAVSDHEVAFHFRRRYPGMLFHTGVRIIPAHVFQDVATNQAALTAHPSLIEPDRDLVVSGPYSVAEWRRGDRLVLEPNRNAFTVQPGIGAAPCLGTAVGDDGHLVLRAVMAAICEEARAASRRASRAMANSGGSSGSASSSVFESHGRILTPVFVAQNLPPCEVLSSIGRPDLASSIAIIRCEPGIGKKAEAARNLMKGSIDGEV